MTGKAREMYLFVVFATLAAGAFIATPGCYETRPAGNGATDKADDHDEKGATDRIAIPPSVRDNLGITFVTVEQRPVESTIRLPGRFELPPEARREYHVMLAGRIDLLIRQYQVISEGQPLFHLDSPAWRKVQSEMVDALNSMKRSHADVAVAEANLTEMTQSVAFLEQRIANLASAKMRQVELESQLSDKKNTLPRLRAELDAARVEFDAAHSRYEVMLGTASSLTGVPVNELDPAEAETTHDHVANRAPPWQSIRRITIVAEAEGVVDQVPITNRGWAEEGDLVLDTVDPKTLRFHADALQTDLTMFADGMRARVVPPQGGSFSLQDTAEGEIAVGFEAHTEERTVPIFLVTDSLPTWAKAGVTAYLEVFLAGNSNGVLAVPESAVIRDGLNDVMFRRNPKNPDEVIRIIADVGVTDGRWVEIKSGVRAGDEVVLGGVYPLMLASSESGAAQKGGHFHPDGTFHGEED